MTRPCLPFLVLSILTACNHGDFDSSNAPTAAVALSAAFTNLASVDVYTFDGVHLKTVDASVDFEDVLPAGSYYMDFVDENDNHSFLSDGRLAFAPMGEGVLPVDGPFAVDGVEAPVWQVEVDEVLEANANLTLRAAQGDETLRAWKTFLPNWQVSLPEDERDVIEDLEMADSKAYSTTTGYTTARLRVTWEASFAMTGKYTTSSSDSTTCNSTTKCWTRTTSTPGATSSYYAVWDYDSNGTGYIDYDESAWDYMMDEDSGVYADGNGSCTQSGYSSAMGCGLSVDTETGKNYTCQSSSGTCTGGSSSSATKPRGGQCKAFQNLLLYRSGQYTGTLPSDSTVSGYSATGSSAPTSSTSNIAVGDVLRRLTSLHSMTVVAYDSSTQRALVVDSNYVGTTSTTYNEYIAARVVGFSTTTYSGYSLLSSYRDLKCVYTGVC